MVGICRFIGAASRHRRSKGPEAGPEAGPACGPQIGSRACTSPAQEPGQELPGQAEALEALKALMAELGGMGFEVPKKPTGEPEAAGRGQDCSDKSREILQHRLHDAARKEFAARVHRDYAGCSQQRFQRLLGGLPVAL
ncbi:unnamed protein product [Symbiodinium natans]|uniref:Uncharacterized protein n=1 Tax=Symbiodinium natans TaxID=878477 RepID=A0A812QHV9_9DINO|nr:unnamed protein product [Symbiodinium natans]